MNVKERFEDKFVIKDNGCWNYTGGKIWTGYGMFWYKGKNVLAHRMSYTLYKGFIDDGLYVLHRCNNKICVNPDHLYLGTHADNMNDCIKDGTFNRGGTGENNPAAKLDDEDVINIKTMLKDKIKQWIIAHKYNVSVNTINSISTGLTWKHVTI